MTLKDYDVEYGIATNEELKAGHALAPMKKGMSRLLPRKWQTWFAAARRI